MTEQPKPFAYSIDALRSIVTVRYESPVTFERWRLTMDLVLADPAFHAGYDFLGDRRGVWDVPDAQYARAVVEYFRARRRQLGRAGWAHVVDPNRDAVYGMARMVEILSNMRKAVEVRVFEDEASAVGWLLARRGDSDRADG